MQTVGPYRLLQALGTCQVGGVWSATDALNNQVTVAVLSASAGRDPGWRSAFAAAANGLVQAGRLPMVTADYSAVTPWIAAAASDASVVAQVFVTLGMSYQPLAAEPAEPGAPEPGAPWPAAPEEPTAPTEPVDAVPPQPVSGAPASASASVPPQPVSTPPVSVVPPRPVSPPPMSPPPMSPPPMSVVPPQPVSAPPTSVASQPSATVPPQPVSGMPSPTVLAASPYDAYAAEPPAGPGGSRRRTWLLVGAVLIGLVVLGGGGGAVALTMRSDAGGPDPTPSSAPPSTAVAAPDQAAQPGIEPPVEGEWPTDWPAFEEQEATPMTDLAGVGFSFEVPEGWSCTPVTTTEDVAHYSCGPGGDGDQVGGELIVHTCPDPCDAERRVGMRRAEEAWGLQWVRDSGYRSWAETDEIDDEPRYGLVLVGYWRTAPEGRIDRQLVLRMTAPEEQTDEIRKVAVSIRGAIHALTPG